MKLLYIDTGIHIDCHIFNEVVFHIDDNNNYVNNFTCNYRTFSHQHQEKLNKIILLCDIKYIDAALLFYNSPYDISYTHFLLQTLPKLNDYDLNTKLLIPNRIYNKFTIDILSYTNINLENIEVLKNNTIYIINDFKQSNKYLNMPDNFTDKHINIFNIIRTNLNITKNINSVRKIYLKRDGIKNGDIGYKRNITNEVILIEKLKELNFEIITLGDKSIKEKKELLQDAEIVISQLGANCMNFIFSNLPKKIILLSHNESGTGYVDYYKRLLDTLNQENTNIKLLTYNTDGIYIDIENDFNKSFSVNVDEIIQNI